MTPTDKKPVPRPGILAIDTYVPGKVKAKSSAKIHKLSSNESPLGPSPKVAISIAEQAGALFRYPDGQAKLLRHAIANAHSISEKKILCGNGSDELLGLLCQTYLKDGDEAIISKHDFLVYKIQILAAGATPIEISETQELKNDINAIIAAVTDKTKLVFLANPNNPTGTYMTRDEIHQLHAGLPASVLLVLDGAYAEFVTKKNYEAGIELVEKFSNVAMTRTFSKIHGLAALRLGWLYADEQIIDALNRVRGPFNVNAIALTAGVAAINDTDHVEKSIKHNTKWLEKITTKLQKSGLKVTPSVGNFILIHFPEELGKQAEDADRYLSERGYILRRVTSYGFPNALRLSVGTQEANLGVINALCEFMRK